jgi:hypothetical protein
VIIEVLRLCTSASVFVRTCMHVCVYVCPHVCVCACICVDVSICGPGPVVSLRPFCDHRSHGSCEV